MIVLLDDDSIDIIVVEHKDRFSRFGLNYIKLLLEKRNRKLEIINDINNNEVDLMQDFVLVITSFCARLYGKRGCKIRTEKIINELNKIKIFQLLSEEHDKWKEKRGYSYAKDDIFAMSGSKSDK